jgi:hypothetical protein
MNAGKSLRLPLKAGGSGRRSDFTGAGSGGVRVEGRVVWEGDEPLPDCWVISNAGESLVSNVTFFFGQGADCSITAMRSSNWR